MEDIEKKYIAYITPKEGVLESITKDAVSVSWLFLCIYVSKGSTWWTFFTGAFTIFILFCIINKLLKKRINAFNTKAELVKWAESLPEDEGEQ